MANIYRRGIYTYNSESRVKLLIKLVNGLFSNPKVANIAGFIGALVPVVTYLL